MKDIISEVLEDILLISVIERSLCFRIMFQYYNKFAIYDF